MGEEGIAFEVCRIVHCTLGELPTRMDGREFGRWVAYLSQDFETVEDKAARIFQVERTPT